MAELANSTEKETFDASPFEGLTIPTGKVTALLDHGASFEGRLTFEGTVRIGGRFHGEIFTNDTLVINPGAKVDAQIEANTVIKRNTPTFRSPPPYQ